MSHENTPEVGDRNIVYRAMAKKLKMQVGLEAINRVYIIHLNYTQI